MKLKGKVAIVTGGSSGIGEHTVIDMVEEGANVVIADINDEAGENLAKKLGDKVIYIHVDVTKQKDIDNMIKKTVDKFSKIDVLFNNAGIGQMYPTHETPIEEWDKIIDINLTGVFRCAKAVLNQMLKQKQGGSIINCSSILGVFGQDSTGAYCAAKGAVTNYTRALAIEYAKENIRVNTVSPGYIDTPLLAALDENMKNHLISLHPLNRLGKPEEVAKAATFLASDDASFITGANLLVDGGFTAGK